MIIFCLVSMPILLYVTWNYQSWWFGEILANLLIFNFIYWGQVLGAKSARKRFEYYFGKNGIYVPESSIRYKFNITVGRWRLNLFPLKRANNDNFGAVLTVAGLQTEA